DRAAGGHVFEAFGGVDELRGGVEREGHHADVEGFDVVGEDLVVAAAEPEEVGGVGEQVGVDFDDGADHGDGPFGAEAGDFAGQAVVDALVEDAEEAEDGPAHEVDVGGDGGVGV